MLCLEQLFVDCNHFSEKLGRGDEFVEALYPRLYGRNVDENYRLLGKISLPDFMTAVVYFINTSLRDKHPRYTLDEYMYKLEYNEKKSGGIGAIGAIEAMERFAKRNEVSHIVQEDPKGKEKMAIKYEHLEKSVIESILWAAYVYCYILHYLEPANAQAKRAMSDLYTRLYGYTQYADRESFEGTHYLMARTQRVGKRFLQNMFAGDEAEAAETTGAASAGAEGAVGADSAGTEGAVGADEAMGAEEDKMMEEDKVDTIAVLNYVRALEKVTLAPWKGKTEKLWVTLMSKRELKKNFVAGVREKEKAFSKKFVGGIIGTLRGKVYEDEARTILEALGESNQEAPIRKYIYLGLGGMESNKTKTDYRQCAEIVEEIIRK